jgi:DNA-binding transcriptional LysR family regulator
VLPGVANGSVVPPDWNPKVKAYQLWNASVGYAGVKNHGTLTVGVKNLLDKDPPFSAAYDGNTGAGSSWEPRCGRPAGTVVEVTFQIDYKFFWAVPDGRCELSTQHTRELVNTLLLGEADLGLSLQDPRHPGIRAEPLAAGAMVALIPAHNPLARQRGPIALAALPQPLIGLAGDDPLGNRFSAACEAQGVALQWRITVQTYQLARALAEAGLGATVVDPFTAASSPGDRTVARPMEPAIGVQLYLLTPTAAPLSQAARRLVRFLGEAAEACLKRA